MPLSPAQLDHWFTYHPPTDETSPKYEAITAAQRQASWLAIEIAVPPYACNAGTHDTVNRLLRDFVEVIDANAPDSADKTAAIRCVRIARNALNEFVAMKIAGQGPTPTPMPSQELIRLATDELIKARWQANSAIALGGK